MFNSHREFEDIGGVGEIPLVGNFTGSGLADIGVYIPKSNSARWVVKQNLGNGKFSEKYYFDFEDIGGIGKIPLVGNFTGSGLADIGVYIPKSNSARWVVKQNLGNGKFSEKYYFDFEDIGGVGETPLIGNFTGNGLADIGVYIPRSNSARWVVKQNLGNGKFSEKYYFDFEDIGGIGKIPLVGNMTGSGKADIGVYIPRSNSAHWVIKENKVKLDLSQIKMKFEGNTVPSENSTIKSGMGHGVWLPQTSYQKNQNQILTKWKPHHFAAIADWIYEQNCEFPPDISCIETETTSMKLNLKFGYFKAKIDKDKSINIFAIRGSANPENVRDDIAIALRGVIPPWLIRAVMEALQKFQDKHGKCHIAVGHSLGGKLLEPICGNTILGFSFNAWCNLPHKHIISFRVLGDFAKLSSPYEDRLVLHPSLSWMSKTQLPSIPIPVTLSTDAHEIQTMKKYLEKGNYDWLNQNIELANSILKEFAATIEKTNSGSVCGIPDLKEIIEMIPSDPIGGLAKRLFK